MMTADDPRLTAYALNELSQAERRAIETELKLADAASREVEAISQIAAVLQTGLAAEPAPDFARSVTFPAVRPMREGQLSSLLRLAACLALCFFILSLPVCRGLVNRLKFFQARVSVLAVSGMFHASAASSPRDELKLHFEDGSAISVAPSCVSLSGSATLLIASLLLGNVFLRSPWRRIALTLLVIPLAIFKIAFAILLEVELIRRFHSDLFLYPMGQTLISFGFVFSFLALLLALRWMRKWERRVG